ncbi:MAG: succinate--CoA ligase subunit alpha [Promethearchaeota archaeon]
MFISENSRVLVQGITGNQGSFHSKLMLEYGTNIVAGVTPNKGGMEIHGIPVFDTVQEALLKTKADTSIVFVPARFALDAVLESLNSGIKIICIITENIPIFDMVRIIERAKELDAKIIGPNCPGILIPDKVKLGIMPSDLCHFGEVTIISKSGTLSYEITKSIGDARIGVSAYVGIGGDPIRGTNMVEAVHYYSKDPNTKLIVLIGEIGGVEEEKTAYFIKENVDKPIIAYIAGKSAPREKRMGHAGAIISESRGTAQDKIKALRNVGVRIAETPWEIPKIIKEMI